jgi:tetratricopeptide (TPR) repeat protein
MPTTSEDAGFVLADRHVAFVGKLGAVTKREAQQLVRQLGGEVVALEDEATDLIVIGADHFPLDEDSLLDEAKRRAAENQLEIITETQLWQRLGLVENEQNVRRMYTPAMLADLLNVPIGIIRRWHRRGLIVPVREVNRLPYFDFQEVASARRLAQLLSAGASPAAIERKLEELARYVPDVERPLAQLSVIVEGRQFLLRQGEGLIEPGGQRRFDFDAVQPEYETRPGHDLAATPVAQRQDAHSTRHPEDAILSCPAFTDMAVATPEDMLRSAADLEDEGRLEAAIDVYRALLMMSGPSAEICFSLAELLYRIGDVSAARERYYMAIELDEDYVEARANLGCVLVEMGQTELAIAAFRGALERYNGYPDVHYHLARTLDDLGRTREAIQHWREFIVLAPGSPWADEAQARLEGDSES